MRKAYNWITEKWYRLLLVLIIVMGLKTLCEIEAWGNPAPVIPPPAINPPVILMFQGGQEPTIFKMPSFAYLGCQPLQKTDKIIKAIHFTATGKNLFGRVITYHEKVYLQTGHNPAKMRMLVTVKSVNKSFSTSGSVSASWSQTNSDYKALWMMSNNVSSALYASGSIAPSFSMSWASQVFDVWYFLIE